MGDFLLRGIEAPLCCSDTLASEICCFPGGQVGDVMQRLPDLVCSTGYYPLLLFHAGTDDTVVSNLKNIKRDYKELGAAVKNLRAQVIFSSALPVRGVIES